MNINQILARYHFRTFSVSILILVLIIIGTSQDTKGQNDSPPTKPSLICLSSFVKKAESLGFCQDGATHILYSPIMAVRVRPYNDNEQVKKDLDDFTTNEKMATVCGYPGLSPECPPLIDATHVQSADTFDASLRQGFKK